MIEVVPPASGGAAEKVLAGYRAHERQLHVGMRVDPAGHQVLAAAIEHIATDGWVDVLANGLDQAVRTQDIGAEAFFVGDHGGATDQQRHAVFPRRLTGLCRFLKLCRSGGQLDPVSADKIRG